MRYLTKDWYIACQTDPMTPEVQKRLDEIDRAYCAAQTREALPDGLLRRFFFHDGAVREIVTGTDLTLRIDSPYSEYHTVTFRNANVKQEPARSGCTGSFTGTRAGAATRRTSCSKRPQAPYTEKSAPPP